MNRYVLLLLQLLALLCGCSASDDGSAVISNSDSRIGFFVENASITRSAGDATEFPTDREFRVYAWDHTDAGSWLMERGTSGDDNSNVVSFVNNRNSWYPNYTYYWPSDFTSVDFYAIYPSDVTFNTTNRKIDFTTSAVSGSDDLLYCKCSTSLINANHYASGVYAAEIVFKHALSRIGFTKDESNGVTLTLNSITFQHIKDKGTFDFDSNTPFWTTDDTSFSDAYSITSLSNSLLLMPQTLSNGAQLIIEYKIQASNGNWLRGGPDGDPNEWYTQTIALSGEWLIGRNYTYTLTASQDIMLSCTIQDWDEADSGNSGGTDFEI